MSPRSLAATTLCLLLLPLSGARPVMAQVVGTDSMAEEARAAFSGTVDEVDAIIQNPSASPAAKRALVERVLERWLDLAFISRAALGPRAKTFSADELTEFAQEFERYVLNLYLMRIARNQGEDFEIRGAVWNAKRQVVTIRAVGGKSVFTGLLERPHDRSAVVEYVLRKRRGEWRLVTLVIDGVDSVRVFRDEFNSVLNRDKPAELISQLRERNTELDRENPFAS